MWAACQASYVSGLEFGGRCAVLANEDDPRRGHFERELMGRTVGRGGLGTARCMGSTEWDEAVDQRLREAFERADREWSALGGGRDEYGNRLASSPEADTAHRERQVAAEAWNDYRKQHDRPAAVKL